MSIARGPTVHELKTWTEFLDDVLDEKKTFEIRVNDRDFAVGDMLWLRGWDRAANAYTGKSARVLVTYLFQDERFLPSLTCVMGIRLLHGPWCPLTCKETGHDRPHG